MKLFLDCLPCALRQVLEASAMVTNDAELQAVIMEESLKILQNYKSYKCSPEMIRDMHETVKRLSNVDDPYKHIKERDISAAKKLMPILKRYIEQNNNKLYSALKISAIGNIIDSAICTDTDLENIIYNELEKEFSICDISDLESKMKTAKSIMFIGDNAGETVFDLMLIKCFSGYDIYYAVRNGPIINDATFNEAYDSGLNKHAKIISTGCNAPGAVLHNCSKEFLSVYDKIDIIISKGQGNFEALSECDRPMFFLLKAKCAMIASILNTELGGYVFKYNK